MSEHPEGFTPPEDDPDSDSQPEEGQPIQGEIQHRNISALIPEGVGQGTLSNGVMILTGAFEIVLDFVLRIGEQQRVVVRCILPKPVAVQFVNALRDNIHNYETRFGPIASMPKPLPVDQLHSKAEDTEAENPLDNVPNEPGTKEASHPNIQDVYDDLKISDEVMPGRYANAVLIRHTGTEFCFDFITNFYPRSAVSSRVFLAAPHVLPLLASLEKSLMPPGTSQDIA